MFFNDVTNRKFVRLTAMWPTGIRTVHNYWLCCCECGNLKVVEISKLTSGNTTSCGCFRRDFGRAIGSTNFKHGHAKSANESPEYRSWKAAIQRCTNPKTSGFEYYGAQGIKVCERWLNSFQDFLQDMGPRPKGTTLGRFGDVGNYEPGNCSWQTQKEQSETQRKKAA